jgi:hypothetical protein
LTVSTCVVSIISAVTVEIESSYDLKRHHLRSSKCALDVLKLWNKMVDSGGGVGCKTDNS